MYIVCTYILCRGAYKEGEGVAIVLSGPAIAV